MFGAVLQTALKSIPHFLFKTHPMAIGFPTEAANSCLPRYLAMNVQPACVLFTLALATSYPSSTSAFLLHGGPVGFFAVSPSLGAKHSQPALMLRTLNLSERWPWGVSERNTARLVPGPVYRRSTALAAKLNRQHDFGIDQNKVRLCRRECERVARFRVCAHSVLCLSRSLA